MQFEWKQEDRYRSNYGAGPETARILCVTDKELTMERWLGEKRHVKAVRFKLLIEFFTSPACGWKLVQSEH